MAGLSYQPSHPLRPIACNGKELPGLDTDSPAQVVQKAFQPPCAGGSCLTRRATSVPQSETWKSTFRPSSPHSACVTWEMAIRAGMSDAAMKVIVSPL